MKNKIPVAIINSRLKKLAFLELSNMKEEIKEIYKELIFPWDEGLWDISSEPINDIILIPDDLA
jgi:hypothetical protein